jgi:hypothetical protein
MMEFTLDLEAVWSSCSSDSLIHLDPHRSECKAGIISPNVILELLGLGSWSTKKFTKR